MFSFLWNAQAIFASANISYMMFLTELISIRKKIQKNSSV